MAVLSKMSGNDLFTTFLSKFVPMLLKFVAVGVVVGFCCKGFMEVLCCSVQLLITPTRRFTFYSKRRQQPWLGLYSIYTLHLCIYIVAKWTQTDLVLQRKFTTGSRPLDPRITPKRCLTKRSANNRP